MSKKVEAISVYDPENPWEQAIQDGSKKMTGHWLPSYPCQMLARAVISLQCNDEWLDREDLMSVRASYFFSPLLIDNKQELVFVTHLLFLRDILENEEIYNQLHDPVVFMTPPLARFLFLHCPVHLHVDQNLLKAHNRHAEFLEIGGFTIIDKADVKLPMECVKDIRHLSGGNSPDFQNVRQLSGLPLKAAAQLEIDEYGEETAFSADHFRALRPDDKVWDKLRRVEGTIEEIDPSVSGNVRVKYNDGAVTSITKEDFDNNYIVVIEK